MDSNGVLTLEIKNNKVVGYIRGDYSKEKVFNDFFVVNESEIDLSKLSYYTVLESKLLLEVDKYTHDLKNKLIEDYFKKLDYIKLQTIENGVEWKEGLIQRGRETDKVNLGLVLETFKTARELGQPIEKTQWKFINKNGEYVIRYLTELDLKLIFIKGSQLLSKAIVEEELLREKIKEMDLETLENFDLETEYKKMVFGIKEGYNK